MTHKTVKSIFKELPYHGVNILNCHGQFNNLLSDALPTKKYLEKLSSIHDLDLFTLNVQAAINPDSNLFNQCIQSHYYSPHSFSILNKQLSSPNKSNFSVFHNNVRSLRSNLENLQIHLLDELKYGFSVIGISETKITEEKGLDFNPSIPGYSFEYVPTPPAAGGVSMYATDSLNYTVRERTSKKAFQALWIKIQFSGPPNIICGIIYRQHNSTLTMLSKRSL